MESIDSLGDQPPISCGFVKTMQLSGGHGCYGRPYRITSTEEVAGSSPVPPTFFTPSIQLSSPKQMNESEVGGDSILDTDRTCKIDSPRVGLIKLMLAGFRVVENR